MFTNLEHFNWYEVAEKKVALMDFTSNVAERRNKSLKNHWQKAPFCRRNIGLYTISVPFKKS